MSVQSPQPPPGNRMEPVRGSAFARCPCGDCAMPPTTWLRAYDFSKFVKLLAKPNHIGRGARESVRKSHSRLLPPQGGLAGAARKGGYGQDTGSVIPIASQMWTRHNLWFPVTLEGFQYLYIYYWNMFCENALVLSTLCLFSQQSSQDPVLACEFHPLNDDQVITLGKGHIHFWSMAGGKLAKKSGIFEVSSTGVLSSYHTLDIKAWHSWWW